VNPGRDEQGWLLCWCGQPIGAVTGLDEPHNLIAHVAEHHDQTLDLEDALALRLRLEAGGGRDEAPD